jgi:hypothetical protein
MSHLGAFVLCLAGFGMLALAMDRPQNAVFTLASKSARRGLRVAATCALLLALSILVCWQGWGLGLVMFSGHTSLAAGFVHCGLIWYMRRSSGPLRQQAARAP